MTEAKNPRIVEAILLALIVYSSGVRAWAGYGGGSGTATDPYLIQTADQLNAIGVTPDDWDKHFKLTADIDLSAHPGDWFHPIGSSGSLTSFHPFKGVFDGGGHAVTGLSHSTREVYSAGFFVCVSGSHVAVKNVRLIAPRIDAPKARKAGALIGSSSAASVSNCSAIDVMVEGDYGVGGLIGESSGTIQNCLCTGEVTSNGPAGGLIGTTQGGTVVDCRFDGMVAGKDYVGGLVGWNKAQITSCGATGSITGGSYVGGLVGRDVQGKIATCWSTATVKGTGEEAGGLVGGNSYDTIESCWASGAVEGNRYAGGFIGRPGGTVSYCRASGDVRGQTYVGGFGGVGSDAISFSYSMGRVYGDENVGGFAPGGLPYLCYWDVQTSGIATGGGRGRTTAQMKNAATFPGWGYGSKWVIAAGVDYPRLIWENTGGSLLVDLPRTYGGGTGKPDDPYRIGTVEQFLEIGCYREDFSKHFLLTNDLDFSTANANEFIPITIHGSFNGGGHRILGFKYMPAGSYTVGLFAGIGYNASVQDLHLVNAQVSSGQDVGALVGRNSGRVRNCSVTGAVEGQRNTGGLIGYNSGHIEGCTAEVQVTGETSAGALAGQNAGWIETCSVKGQVTGQNSVGGLTGRNDNEILHSSSTADVSGQQEIGGLVGTAGNAGFWMACPAEPPHFVPGLSNSRITASYSLGQVTGQKSVGGLAGKNSGVIMGCYAASPIEITAASAASGQQDNQDNTDIGGLVGKNEYGVVHSSYWDTQVSTVAQSAGGRGRTTAQMTAAETFRGWSSFSVWAIDEGRSYPYLQWAQPSGEQIPEDPHRYGGGDGTSAVPYQIRTPAHLANIGCYPSDWDKTFILMNDLDLAGVDPNAFWPIGTLTSAFTGNFNGDGHSIANFTFRRGSELYAGLFGSIGRDLSGPAPNTGDVFNLSLRDVDVSGCCYVGGLTAHNRGTISSCSVTGQVTAAGKNAGGLAAFNEGAIKDCSSACTVTARQVAGSLTGYNTGAVTSASGSGTVRTTGQRDSYAGGLIGENGGTIQLSHFIGTVLGKYTAGGLVALNEGTISMCSARATVTGSYLLGGLVGYNESMTTISRSFAEGTATGGDTVGGLVGYNGGQVQDCFATGRVEGGDRIGGLVGENGSPREIKFCYSACRVIGRSFASGLIGTLSTWSKLNITSCFWDVDSSGTSDGVGSLNPDPDGARGLSTSAMQTAALFTAAGWDFSGETGNGTDDIWGILDGQGYPRLRWELGADVNDVEPYQGRMVRAASRR